jgi:hypothetical protein
MKLVNYMQNFNILSWTHLQSFWLKEFRCLNGWKQNMMLQSLVTFLYIDTFISLYLLNLKFTNLHIKLNVYSSQSSWKQANKDHITWW